MGDVLDCAKPIKEILKFLTEDDLRNYVLDVMAKAREMTDKRGINAMKSAQKAVDHTMFNELVANYFENAQATIQNFKLFERNSDILTKTKSLRDIIARNSGSNANRANNIESAMKAEQNYLMNTFLKDLSDEDISFLQNKDNSLDIARAMFQEAATPMARKIADAFKRYVDERSFQAVESHSLPLRYVNKERFLKMSHDPSKMMAGFFDKVKMMLKGQSIDHAQIKNQWINFTIDHLDLEKTFVRTKADKGEAGIDMDEVRKSLSRSYDRITTGSDDVLGHAIHFKDLDMLQKKSQSFYVWKDAEAYVNYNNQYGTGDLFSAFMNDVHSSGRKIGMARVMGSKPSTMYKKLAELQQEVAPKGPAWKRSTGLIFNQVSGADNQVVSPTLAAFGSNLRTWASMGSLAALPLQSIGDINMATNWMKRFDVNYMSSTMKQIDTVFRGQFADEDIKKIGKQFYSNLNSHAGYMGRFAEAQNMGQITNKLSTGYFTANGTMAWDKGNKMGIMAQTATALYQVSHLPYDGLSMNLKKTFAQFGITPEEWNVLRTKNQGKMFSLDNVDSLTHDELKQINKGAPDRALYEVKNETYRKIFSLFDVGAEQAILRPGAYEKAFMYQGLKPGTIPGEAVRTLMQFKGFPISYIMRQLIMGYKNADSAQAKLAWGLQQFVYTLPLSFASTYMYFMGQGKTMPDPSKMSFADQRDFYMGILAAPLGNLNNIWAAENHNSKDLIMSLFSGPTTRFLGASASTVLSLGGDDPKQIQKNARDTFLSVFPASNVPFFSPYLRHALGQKPFLLPGQQIRSWAPGGS